VVAVAAIGGFFVWRGTAGHTASQEVARPAPSDPSRRFNIYVKSEPPGADIFLDGKPKPVGATPISLPIDLSGVSSIQMVLKKPGYEDYQQIITTDSPVSISLQPLEAPPPAPSEAPAAAPTPTTPEAEPAAEDSDSSAKAKRRPSASGKRPSPRKGEIVDPF